MGLAMSGLKHCEKCGKALNYDKCVLCKSCEKEKEGGQAMTKEQEKAIYRLNLHKDTQVQDDCCIVNIKDIETVLSTLEEKDKIIDLMAEMISIYDLDIPTLQKQQKERYCEFIKSDEDCCWKTDKTCADCIKQYFENEAKEVQ